MGSEEARPSSRRVPPTRPSQPVTRHYRTFPALSLFRVSVALSHVL